jgi:hypothetical protein
MAKKILSHYKFRSRPNPAKGELCLGTVLCGIEIPHATIECSMQEFVHPRTQDWIRDILGPRLTRTASLVIVILPQSEC